MPHRMWSHSCCGQRHASPAEFCPACGRPGLDQGMQLTLREKMAAYQNVHGLKPIGPHRKLADRLHAGARRKCDTCGGCGLLVTNFEDLCLVCETCGGIGSVLPGGRADEAVIREQVLREFPDAGVPFRICDITSLTVVEDLGSGAMRDIRKSERPRQVDGGW
jgi:hypothetical protein